MKFQQGEQHNITLLRNIMHSYGYIAKQNLNGNFMCIVYPYIYSICKTNYVTLIHNTSPKHDLIKTEISLVQVYLTLINEIAAD